MKACSSALNTHIQQGQTTLTTVLTIMRTDGQVIVVTEHDEDLVFNSAARAALNPQNFLHSIGHDVTAVSYAGFSKFNLNDKANLDASNIQLQGMIDSTIFTRKDLGDRRFDSANAQVFMVNWRDLSQGDIILHTGEFGEAEIDEYSFKMGLFGLAKKLEDVGGETCTPTCRVDFGSPRCAPGGVLADGTTIDSLNQSGTISVTDRARTFTATGLTSTDGYFDGGLLTWLTGLNAGLSIEVKSFLATGDITLFMQALDAITIGDTFKISPGCDKTFATCRDKFHNGLNNQSEPYVPGEDNYLAYPDYHAPHS